MWAPGSASVLSPERRLQRLSLALTPAVRLVGFFPISASSAGARLGSLPTWWVTVAVLSRVSSADSGCPHPARPREARPWAQLPGGPLDTGDVLLIKASSSTCSLCQGVCEMMGFMGGTSGSLVSSRPLQGLEAKVADMGSQA